MQVDMKVEAPREICTHLVENCIRGHHVLKDFWTPFINKVLVCIQESENPHDPYAVAVKKEVWWLDCAQKNFSCLLTDWNYYSYCKGQPSVFQQLTPGWTRSTLHA